MYKCTTRGCREIYSVPVGGEDDELGRCPRCVADAVRVMTEAEKAAEQAQATWLYAQAKRGLCIVSGDKNTPQDSYVVWKGQRLRYAQGVIIDIDAQAKRHRLAVRRVLVSKGDAQEALYQEMTDAGVLVLNPDDPDLYMLSRLDKPKPRHRIGRFKKKRKADESLD